MLWGCRQQKFTIGSWQQSQPSAVSAMQLICMAKKRGTKVISVVRREDVVQELKDLGYASLISGLHAFLDGQSCCVASARAGSHAQGSVKSVCCLMLSLTAGRGGVGAAMLLQIRLAG